MLPLFARRRRFPGSPSKGAFSVPNPFSSLLTGLLHPFITHHFIALLCANPLAVPCRSISSLPRPYQVQKLTLAGAIPGSTRGGVGEGMVQAR